MRRTRLEITPIAVFEERTLFSGLRLISGAFTNGPFTIFDFEETRNWPTQPSWAGSPASANTFAVIYRNVSQIRLKFPFLVIYVSQLVTVPEPFQLLQQEVFQLVPYTEVHTNMRLAEDGDFHPFEGVQVFLFDVGKGDFIEFGSMVDELSAFQIAFLMSARKPNLARVKGCHRECATGFYSAGETSREFRRLLISCGGNRLPVGNQGRGRSASLPGALRARTRGTGTSATSLIGQVWEHANRATFQLYLDAGRTPFFIFYD